MMSRTSTIKGSRSGVKNLIAGFAIDQDVLRAQDGEVLGGVGLLDAETFDEGAGGEFAIAEEFDDGDAGGVGEGLEELGFEASQGFLHNEYSLIRMPYYGTPSSAFKPAMRGEA